MIGKHNVVVAALGTNTEATHIVGVQLDDGFNPDVELLGIDGRNLAGDVRKGVEGDWLRIFFEERTPF